MSGDEDNLQLPVRGSKRARAPRTDASSSTTNTVGTLLVTISFQCEEHFIVNDDVRLTTSAD